MAEGQAWKGILILHAGKLEFVRVAIQFQLERFGGFDRDAKQRGNLSGCCGFGFGCGCGCTMGTIKR